MTVKFDETKIPENYSKTLISKNFSFPAPFVGKIGKVLMDGISRCLGSIKEIDRPHGIVFRTLNGTFLAAGIVQFNRNEDDPDNLSAGNWSYTWTFKEEDLDGVNTIESTNQLVTPFIESSGVNLFQMKFNDSSIATMMITLFIEMLSAWLRENAKEGEIVTIELPGAFKASAEVNEGKVEIGLTPDGNVKTLIKGDEMYQDN